MQYSLLDSGEGSKLESFGGTTLVRPARSAIWKKRREESVWKSAAASYEHGSGWKFSEGEFESWSLQLNFGSLTLRLQRNGQIGFFPEHALYLDKLGAALGRSGSTPKVLNLFAYTGIATVFCAKAGAHVTHLDISKQALEWAEINLKRNDIEPDRVRFIKEDASAFIAREVRRGGRYDVIVMDPPTFSRVTKSNSWDLEDVLYPLLSDCGSLLTKDGGSIFFTSHHQGIGRYGVANVLLDLLGPNCAIEHEELVISEQDSERKLHSGYLVSASSKMD